jgi:hypothetical protein
MTDDAMTIGRTGTDELRRQLEADAAAWSERGESGGLLDRARLRELDGWLTDDARRTAAISDTAESFIVASRVARRGWWPSKTTTGGALALLLILIILATPITLLSIVGFTAALIHRVLN